MAFSLGIKFRITAVTIVALWLLTFAKIVSAAHLEVAKWEVLDITVDYASLPDNPFILDDIATFKHESGRVQLVPLVYNGGNEYLLRFSAGLTGKWTYELKSAHNPTNTSGQVLVTANKDKTNHGAMVIKQDTPQAFAYEDGTPYYLLAFELDWLYALDYHNPNGTPKSEQILSLVKENGFNHLIMNVFAYDVNWTKDPKLKHNPQHEYGAPKDIFPFLGNNDNPDFSALNVDFFKKLDRSIQLLHDKRIVAHLMIYVWNKLVAWPDMNTEADNMYFDYVVKRYGAYPNIVWDISKEALFYGRADEAYIKDRIERLRSQNYFDRLVTVHDYKYCAKYTEQVDFISTQDWRSELYTRMLDVRNKFKDKPIFNIEHGGYEKSPYLVWPGDYDDAAVSLRRNWLSVFAGVYSTYYWQGTSWNVVIHDPYDNPDEFTPPKFEYFKPMADLFTKYDYSKFKPISWKNGSGYTLVDDEETYLIYVRKENYQMSRGDWFLKPKKDGSNQRLFYWLNTLTGETTLPAKISKSQLFISPWRGEADSILISEKIKN